MPAEKKICRSCLKPIKRGQSYGWNASIHVGSPYRHFECMMQDLYRMQPPRIKEAWVDESKEISASQLKALIDGGQDGNRG